MAAALASFRTSMDSISEGLIVLKGSLSTPPEYPRSLSLMPGSGALLLKRGTPSITYKGVPPPRIFIESPPPGWALFWLKFKPAALPCNKLLIEALATWGRFLVETETTEPVTSRRLWAPYPTTTTSSKSDVETASEMLRLFSEPTDTSLVWYPT